MLVEVLPFLKRTDIFNTLYKGRHTPQEKYSNESEITYSSRCGSRKQWQYATTSHDHVVHHLRDEVNGIVYKYDIVTAIHKVHHSFCRMTVRNTKVCFVKILSENSFFFFLNSILVSLFTKKFNSQQRTANITVKFG